MNASDPAPVFVMLTLDGVRLDAHCPVKFKLVGFTASEGVAADPMPLNDTTIGELGVSFRMVSAAERLPAAVGQNFRLSVQLALGASTCPTWQDPRPPKASHLRLLR